MFLTGGAAAAGIAWINSLIIAVDQMCLGIE
jgi:hypothetical protein